MNCKSHTAGGCRACDLPLPAAKEPHHGEIRQSGATRGQEGNPQDKTWHATERQGRESQEPQAGDRHRAFQGAKERRQSAAKEEELALSYSARLSASRASPAASRIASRPP